MHSRTLAPARLLRAPASTNFLDKSQKSVVKHLKCAYTNKVHFRAMNWYGCCSKGMRGLPKRRGAYTTRRTQKASVIPNKSYVQQE